MATELHSDRDIAFRLMNAFDGKPPDAEIPDRPLINSEIMAWNRVFSEAQKIVIEAQGRAVTTKHS